MKETRAEIRPERILELTARLNQGAGERIAEIVKVNRIAKMLSVNALVVAARAGEAGKSFAVVAEEFKRLAAEIDRVASALEGQVQADLRELSDVGAAILSHMRGQRMADLALNAIEIIDRNLYERTCDVRWWATDSMVVDCLTNSTSDTISQASSRLGVILNAYTVYLDLWICDSSGRVIANGRPDRYPGVRRTSVAGTPWFAAAMMLNSGDDFTASNIETVSALDNAPVATYATAVREGGVTTGKVIGVLGIHFDWQPQAQAVVNGVRLTEDERQRSRVMILDQNRRVLASSDGKGVLSETIPLDIGNSEMGSYWKGDVTVAYAVTPGYETYKGMGWIGCLMQTL